MAPRKSPPKRIIKVPTNCPFCNKKVEPSYVDYKTLKKFMSDRARIYGRSRTGVCSKHQRRLTQEIKRARFLALLPFVPKM